jgi:hypothetical protein
LHNKQSFNINQILGEAIAFKQNLILIRKLALSVNGKEEKRTETNNGLVTPNATPDVNNGRIDAEKARQAAVATAAETGNGQDLTETENHYSSNKSDSKLSDYKTDSDKDVVPVLLKNRIDNVTETNKIL